VYPPCLDYPIRRRERADSMLLRLQTSGVGDIMHARNNYAARMRRQLKGIDNYQLILHKENEHCNKTETGHNIPMLKQKVSREKAMNQSRPNQNTIDAVP